MNASSGQKARRPLVWWGVGLMVAAVIGGVVGVVGAVTQAAGGVIDAFTADEYTTPMNAQFDFEEGDYLVYEFTGKTQSAGSNVGDNSRGVTVTPDAVTVTSASGAQIPVKNQWLAESVTRGASEYTGAARFEITQAGTYTVNVQTPNTRVLVAPSIVSGFGDALIWLALLGLSGVAMVIGVVLLIVGLVRGSRSVSPPAPVPAAGWYADPRGQAQWRWFDGNSWTDRTG